MRKTRTAEKSHELGTNHNNNMAHKNGLDEIDLWAANQGSCLSHLDSVRPNKRNQHKICI